MPTVAQFVSAEIAPLMKSVGYRRKGGRFAIDGPDGLIGVVAVTTDNRGADGLLGVNLSYGVVVPTHLEYWLSIGLKPFPFPAVDEALVWKEVAHPFTRVEGDVSDMNWLFPFRWALPDEQAPRLGELMRQALTDEVIPGVQNLFDTEAQVRWLSLPPDLGVRAGFERKQGRVLAYLRYGADDPRTRAALAELEPEAPVAKWFIRRYGTASAGPEAPSEP